MWKWAQPEWRRPISSCYVNQTIDANQIDQDETKSKCCINYDLTTVVGPVAVVVTTVMMVLARPSGKSRATSPSRMTVAWTADRATTNTTIRLNERAIFFLFSCWAGSWSWVYPTRIGWRSNSTKGVEMAAFFYTSRALRLIYLYR